MTDLPTLEEYTKKWRACSVCGGDVVAGYGYVGGDKLGAYLCCRTCGALLAATPDEEEDA